VAGLTGLVILFSILVRKKTKLLTAEKNRYKAIVEAMPDILVHEDINGTLLKMHFPADAQYQFSPEKGESVYDHLPERLARIHVKYVKRALKSGKTQVYQHTVYKGPIKCFEEIRIAPVNEKEVIVIVRDISRIKEYEHELIDAKMDAENASKSKSRFISHISHELRTPISGIIGINSILKETPLDSEQREYSEIIDESSHSLLAMINDLLDVSKIEAGKMSISPEKFKLTDLLKQLERTAAGLVKDKDIEFRHHYAIKSCQIVETDRLRLGQILTNLLGNAVKFTSKGSVELKVKVTKVDEKTADFEFEVVDTGIGIPEKMQKLIFEEFEQVDHRPCKKHHGTGLGLTISNSLANLLGGKLELESEPGAGSTFRLKIRLPAASSLTKSV
jgi:signal transduction histidine kinase